MRTVAFSPDGSRLVGGGRNGRLRLWDATNGQTLHNWNAHTGRIRALTFSPDGMRLASAGEDRQILIWDVGTAGKLIALDSMGAKVLAISFCGPNQLASGGSDNAIRIWDLESKQEVKRLTGHTGSIATLDCHHAQRLLISGSFDTTARVWRLDEALAGVGDVRGSDLPGRTALRR
jgi:WD40 repeat protein